MLLQTLYFKGGETEGFGKRRHPPCTTVAILEWHQEAKFHYHRQLIYFLGISKKHITWAICGIIQRSPGLDPAAVFACSFIWTRWLLAQLPPVQGCLKVGPAELWDPADEQFLTVYLSKASTV